MKIKLLSLAVIMTMGFSACDTYEESESVAALRNAKAQQLISMAAVNNAQAAINLAEAERVKAEIEYQNAQTAFQNALVKKQEIANAMAEATNAIDLQKLQVQLEEAQAALETNKIILEERKLTYEVAKLNHEKALLVFEAEKIVLENNIVEAKRSVQTSNNDALIAAYGKYTTAYTDWSTKSVALLDLEDALTDAKFVLLDKQALDYKVLEGAEEELADLNTELTEKNEYLVELKALETANDWSATLTAIEDKEAEKLNLQTVLSVLNNKKADAVNLVNAAINVWDEANTVKNDVYNELNDWRFESRTENGMSFNGVDLSTETGLSNYGGEYDNIKARLITEEADALAAYTVANTNAAAAPNDNALADIKAEKDADYETAKAANAAFTLTAIKAEVDALNAKYTSAIATVTTAYDAYDVAYEDYNTAGDAYTAKATEYNNTNTELNQLRSIYFVFESSLNNAENAQAALENNISTTEGEITSLETSIHAKEVTIEAIEAGNYDQKNAVENQKLAIVKLETQIEEAKILVETSKSLLDMYQAQYLALLEE